MLLIENCFFYLIDIPEILSPYMSYFIKVLLGFLSLCIFIMVFFTKKTQRYLSTYKSFLYKYIAVCLFSVLIIIFLTYASGLASFKTAFLNSCSYFTFLLCFPILLSMKNDKEVERVFDVINIFTLIVYVLVIIQSFLYNNQGVIILKYLNSTLSIRNDRIRLDVLPFGNIMLIYNFFIVIYRKEKRNFLHFINLVMGLFILFYIEQTRAMIVIVMTCYAFFLIVENSTLSKLFTNSLLIVITIVVLINTGALDNFMATFSSDDYAGSSIARDYAITYYLSIFKSNPLFGFGFTANESLIRGPLGTAFVDDVGIWGQMARLGVFAYIILIPLLVRWGKIALYMKKNAGTSLYIAIWIYVIATSFTLMIFDSQRIMLLPFLIAIFEFVYKKQRNREFVATVDDRGDMI